jgi:hypothetical protein
MDEARRERVKALDLKAHLFRQLCFQVADRGAEALEEAWSQAGKSTGHTVSTNVLKRRE